jgi:beta-fructofuranosidase
MNSNNKMHEERLVKAEEAVNKIKSKIADSQYRQKYHFMAPAGWMNDPNGFIQYDGKYHLFYQHYPYGSKWGSMHWGHAVSENLVEWEHLPIALAPSETYDDDEAGGCFSGSAVDDNGVLTLIYTGTTNNEEGTVQVQCIATSGDGIKFEKYENNPVISKYPEDGDKDFRDPKAWREGDTWYTVVGSTKNNNGRALLYKSKDFRKWEYVGVLAESNGMLGTMWECPDFFRLGNKYVLIFSPMGLGDITTMYLVGDMDYQTGKFTWSTKGQIDFGCDFYAPQSLYDDKGRRILIGWANSWQWMPWFNGFGPTQKEGWNGAMSIPRVVELDESGKLRFTPIEEIKEFRKNYKEYKSIVCTSDPFVTTASNNNCYEIEFEINLMKTSAKELVLKLRETENGFTIIKWDLKNKKLVFDRSKSDQYSKGEKSCNLELKNNILKGRILSDMTSIEVFTDNNKVSMSSNIYPSGCNDKIKLYAVDGEICINKFQIWSIEK